MRVKEIFYSLQGEGFHTGTPAVFVRLSGCNLRCPFCDTDHADGREMTAGEIVGAILAYPSRHVVVTGGEPSLQLDEELVGALRGAGFFIQVETNGTRPLPDGIDWVTCSPKGAPLAIGRADELKLVFGGGDGMPLPSDFDGFDAAHRFLQPCDTGDAGRNAAVMAACVEYVKGDPRWRLSLQTHKLIDIP
ncbi:MAG: 7-carboxy-7-deazaguanine synthase QueE [Muribaculaceae bacterium]|nr:7-carboxy-7-deazaguanine synthase QueE [Muribaculaceae bacterium]